MSYTHGHKNRRLTAALGLYVLAVSGLTLVLMRWMPEDPLSIRQPLQYYTALACLVSVLGIVGARQADATSVEIFANFLVLDVFISAIPKLFFVTLSPDIQASVCNANSIAALVRAHEASLTAGLDADAAARATALATRDYTAQCKRMTTILLATTILGVVSLMLVEALLAARVMAYGMALRRAQDADEYARARSQEMEKGEVK